MRLSRESIRPVAIACGLQVAVALTIASVQVTVPEIAGSAGIDVHWIGPYVALCYAVAMATSLRAGDLVLRHGAIRAGQICLAAAGGAALLFSSGKPPLMAAAAIGYGVALGLVVPASSQLIARHTDSRELPLAMSLGQSGMTLGRLTAGLAVPTLALALGWQTTLTGWAVLAVAAAVLLEPLRHRFDPRSSRFHTVVGRGLWEPLARILESPDLCRLAFASIAFASAQLSLVVYLVTYMTVEAHLPLVVAGLAFSVAQAAGIASRYLIGGLASVSGRPRLALALVGIGMAAALAGAAGLSPAWPTPAVLLGAVLLGSVAMSWNGLLFSEVVRASGVGQAATVTGAVSFITFLGLSLGPAVFGILLELGGRYADGFLAFAGLVGVASLAILPRPAPAAEAP